jgi:hypothetical protein
VNAARADMEVNAANVGASRRKFSFVDLAKYVRS